MASVTEHQTNGAIEDKPQAQVRPAQRKPKRAKLRDKLGAIASKIPPRAVLWLLGTLGVGGGGTLAYSEGWLDEVGGGDSPAALEAHVKAHDEHAKRDDAQDVAIAVHAEQIAAMRADLAAVKGAQGEINSKVSQVVTDVAVVRAILEREERERLRRQGSPQ